MKLSTYDISNLIKYYDKGYFSPDISEDGDASEDCDASEEGISNNTSYTEEGITEDSPKKEDCIIS